MKDDHQAEDHKEGAVVMRPRDWLLILLRQARPEEPDTLDPVRVQKGMFYFASKSIVPAKEKYNFVPYYFGPCSFDIYRDIEQSIHEGLIEAVPVSGQSWRKYTLTEQGLERADKLASAAQSHAVQACAAARSRVIGHTFRTLLKEVYEQYPEYAVESVLKNLP